MKLLTFAESLAQSATIKRHLLLGNGFSIACRPGIFVYKKLFEQADFGQLSPTAKRAFDALATQDFEQVIKALRVSHILSGVYGGSNDATLAQFLADADGLRELLVQTIAASHPAWPGEISHKEFLACRAFLAHFANIYTLNYDLLLYWTVMHVPGGEYPTSDDGFRTPEDDPEAGYVVWEPGNSKGQNLWFLHGALHLFDTGLEVQKYTWCNTGERLIDQIRRALGQDYFPIFVSEGTSREKMVRIRHNDYLGKAYRSFSEIGGALFIYGHSLASNDEHFLNRIEKGKVTQLYVGIYGDPQANANKAIIRRAQQMADNRPRLNLKVFFYDAASAKVWEK